MIKYYGFNRNQSGSKLILYWSKFPHGKRGNFLWPNDDLKVPNIIYIIETDKKQ